MTDGLLLAIDGSPGSGKAIDFALERAKRGGDKVTVAYVIEWSPYSFNTPEENEQRHERRNAEIERATKSIVEPVVAQLKEAGVEVKGVVRHGHPAQTVADLATQEGVSHIIIGRVGESGLKSLLFGSVAANLVQTSKVPVTVVP